MQLYFFSCCVFQPVFLGSNGKILWLLLKTKWSVFHVSVLTVFRCSTSYTVLIVLWKMLMELVIAPARWWPCACLKCVSGLRRLEKSLNFLRCIHVIDLVLKYGWHKWRKLNTASFLSHCIDGLMGIVTADIGMSFFSYVSGFRLKFFSYCTLTERFAIGFQKWFDHEWIDFGFFFVGKWLLSSTSYLYGLKSARIAQFLLFFDDNKFFRCLVWGVFWSVL